MPNDNPNPQLNFFWTGTPEAYAGDVNGDGHDDFIEAQRNVRDERTTQLEDQTDKTALFYGGSGATGESEDQLVYQFLRPSGDLNGDGFDDAIRIDREAATIRFYTGSSSGYRDSKIETDISATDVSIVRGFSDLDGDGIEDVLLGAGSADEFSVVHGASDLLNVSVEAFQPGTDEPSFRYGVADLDGSDGAEIVRLAGENTDTTNIRLQVFEVGETSVTNVQDKEIEELVGAAEGQQLALIDINGNGQQELATTLGGDSPTFAFAQESASGAAYQQVPETLGKDDAVPIGDLDGDGNHDFYTYDEAPDTRYVSYGPDDLSEDLTFDTEIPYSDPAVGAAGFSPQGEFGDLDGDETDDAVLGYFQSETPPRERGRRLAFGQEDRSVQTETVAVPYRRVTDRVVSTANVGDLNGDEIGDVAACFFDRGQVGIYYGGSSFGDQPDETLETGWLPYVAAGGDFNGDGTQDVAAVSVGNNREDSRLDVFFGGTGPADHTVTFDEVAPSGYESGFYHLSNAGGLNNDEADDLVVSAPFSQNDNGEYLSQIFVYYGGSSLSTAPDATIDYADSLGTGFLRAGYRLTGAGDFNDDGIEDVAVGLRGRENENSTEGAVHLFYGEEGGPTFSDGADLMITPAVESGEFYNDFSGGLRGGTDVDGDGKPDLVVSPWTFGGGHAAHVYYGGSDPGRGDAVVDEYLDAPVDALGPRAAGNDFDGDGLVDFNFGNLALSDIDQDGPAEVLLTTGFGINTHVLRYAGQSSTPNDAEARGPGAVFEAPNASGSLGGAYKMATGDLTGDGNVDILATASSDNNDAAWSSRLYRYQPATPAASASEIVDTDGPYAFDGTGTTIGFTGTEGSGTVKVDKFDDGPGSIAGIGESNVSAYRFQVQAPDTSALSFEAAELRFDVSTLSGIGTPGSVEVYTRESSGDPFVAPGTSYDGDSNELVVEVSTFSEFAFASDSDDNPLPVELAAFDATVDGDRVRLTWQTASETGNAGFRVQRRPVEQNGSERWQIIGRVDGAGTTTETRSYRFMDTGLPYEADRLSYRLKQVDTDGSEHFSEEVTVDQGVSEVELLSTYPNPAWNQATVRYALPEKRDVTIRLYDVLGREARTVVNEKQEGRHERQVDLSGLSSGIYFLRLQSDGQVRTQKLTVVR